MSNNKSKIENKITRKNISALVASNLSQLAGIDKTYYGEEKNKPAQ